MKGLSEEVNTFDNLMSSIATTHYQTNDGFVKGSELEGKYYVIITGEDTALLESVTISNELQDVIPRFIAVKNNDELTELLWYQDIIEPRSSNDPLPPAKFTLDFDTYGHALSRSIFVAGYDEDLKFTDHDYDLNRAVYVLRSYWIKQLLPSNYSKVFIHAIQNDVESLDDIEAQAQALNEVLKK
jgi:hypothetical protein